MKRTDTQTLISAMRILARDVQCDDGIANAAIAEAADRLEELHNSLLFIRGRCETVACSEEFIRLLALADVHKEANKATR